VSTDTEPYLRGSPIYDPVAVLRRDGEILIIARVGKKASQRFMILTPVGDPAWPHEPFGSLSDVGWSLRAHGWHLVTPEPTGPIPQPARTLARLLAERA
jgi:hypothetical protein